MINTTYLESSVWHHVEMPEKPDFKALKKDKNYGDYKFFSGLKDKDILKQWENECKLALQNKVRFADQEKVWKQFHKTTKCSFCEWLKSDHASKDRCYHYSDESEDYFYKDKFFTLKDGTYPLDGVKVRREFQIEDSTGWKPTHIGMYDRFPENKRQIVAIIEL